MNREELSLAYDTLYDEGTAVLERDNPCQFIKTGDKLACTNPTGPCCGGCKYLGPDGCTVKALGCRVWLCYHAQEKFPQTFIALKDIKSRAETIGIPTVYRGSKDEHLRHHHLSRKSTVQGQSGYWVRMTNG